MVSLVAATTPLQARAASKLLCEVASACQILVRTTRKPKKIAVGRRPKMFEMGTMSTFANPSVMTFKPVNKLNCCWFKWNSLPSRGNNGASESAEQTRTQT